MYLVRNGSGCLVVFGLLWSSFLLIFDTLLLGSWPNQFKTRNYPSVPALVLSSSVEMERSGSKSVFRPKITYQYSVGTQVYTSSRIRYNQVLSDGRKTSQELVDRFPKDGRTQIAGFLPQDFLLLLFITPFHVAGLGLLASPWLMGGSGKAGFPLTQRGSTTTVQVAYTHPLVSAVGCLGCFSFALIFFNGVVLSMKLGWTAVYVQAGLLTLAALHSALSTARANSNPATALSLDSLARSLTYQQQRWSWDEIGGLEVESESSKEQPNSYCLVLRLRSGGSKRLCAGSQARLNKLARWLTEQIFGR
jgi:hypothetical protein